MCKIKSNVSFATIITVCFIVIVFIVLLSFLISFLFGLFSGEKLSREDEAYLSTQINSKLLEYKNVMSSFEKQTESMEIVAPYSVDISPNKEIQYVDGRYSVDISSNIHISVSEGLWINNGEIKHVNTFNCGTVDYIQKNCFISDIENWTFTEDGFLNAILQKFYCDYYDVEYNFKDEILSLKNELIDNYNKKISNNEDEKIYMPVKREFDTPFLHIIKISIQATDETNSSFNMFIDFYRNY